MLFLCNKANLPICETLRSVGVSTLYRYTLILRTSGIKRCLTHLMWGNDVTIAMATINTQLQAIYDQYYIVINLYIATVQFSSIEYAAE